MEVYASVKKLKFSKLIKTPEKVFHKMNVIFNKVLLKKIDPQHRSFIGVDNYREKFEKNVK